MVKVLFALFRPTASRVLALEMAGAASLVFGASLQWGAAAGWIVVGAALLAKSFELDVERDERR